MGGLPATTAAAAAAAAASGADGGINPYNDAILRAAASSDDAQLEASVTQSQQRHLQSLYHAHRTGRNAKQRELFLAPDYAGVAVDGALADLLNGIPDPRNCLVVWARPPDHIVRLAVHLQKCLKKAAPNLWLMPPHRLHMTTLEITHSKTPDEIGYLVDLLRPSLDRLTAHTFNHRSRLVKPLLSYDLAGVALTFLPAAGEPLSTPTPMAAVPLGGGVGVGYRSGGQADPDDTYSYHHVRRDVYALVRAAGLEPSSRYVVPSAHVTLARFVVPHDHAAAPARAAWIAAIEKINRWLETAVWSGGGGGDHNDQDDDGSVDGMHGDGPFVGEWIVGQENGLLVRAGSLWYGGGRTVAAGEGF
ncbi:Ureidoglycolate lyase [Cladochytrium tenue]|nr:Ureidoglycolate lyase [Cladochytrium tenue]